MLYICINKNKQLNIYIMKKYEITEEQILDLASGKSKSKIKVGKWYKLKSTDAQINSCVSKDDFIFVIESNKNKILNLEIFKKHSAIGLVYKNHLIGYNQKGNVILFGRNNELKNIFYPQITTYKEVKQALENECIKRFGENWGDSKIEKCMYGGVSNMGNFCISISVVYNQIWNKNGCIFNNGKWAEPLKTV